jgi:hypothetical protein
VTLRAVRVMNIVDLKSQGVLQEVARLFVLQPLTRIARSVISIICNSAALGRPAATSSTWRVVGTWWLFLQSLS